MNNFKWSKWIILNVLKIALSLNYMDKITVYVQSIEPSSTNYIDMHSVEHPCSQAGNQAFTGMKHYPGHSSGFLSDEERRTIELVEEFSREHDVKYEVVDLAKAGATVRLKFVIRSWKTPVICCGKEILLGLPTREKLESMLKR